MWKLWALLSAIFAALAAIFGKIGVDGVSSNLATAIRTAVILVLTWGIIIGSGGISQLVAVGSGTWVSLVLSGVATGLSWLFYYKALQLGEASKVAPIDKLSVVFVILFGIVFLHETADAKVLLGGALILAGSLVMLL